MGAAEVAAILAPVILQFLRRAGSEARAQLAERLGGETADSVAALWERLRGRITNTEPDSSDGELESQIAAVLLEDPSLLRNARTTAHLLVTGDRNTVQHGNTNISISGGNNIQIGQPPD